MNLKRIKMTREEMLSSIENKIRKDSPRLSTIGEGCCINFYNKNGEKEKGKIVKLIYKTSENILDTQELYAVLVISEGEQDYSTHFLGIRTIEIIGHDIMLNDVLEWLNIKLGCSISKGRYAILPNGEFIFIEYEQREGFDIVKTFLYWNLPSPYLKDQSEEFIKFLYELKKRIK